MKTARLLVPTALCVLAVALMAGGTAAAQTGAASLTGLITDQSGAAVPGATVTATSQATNVAYPAVANSVGNYTITSLPVGAFHLREGRARGASRPASPSRFSSRPCRWSASISSWSSARIEETVVVSSETQVLQTETATVGEVISGSTLAALPLNGRNTGQLSLLLPGVVTPNPSAFTEDPQLQQRPAVPQRQPRADEQLHDRRRRHEQSSRSTTWSPTSPAPTRSPRSASRPTTTPPIPATSPAP